MDYNRAGNREPFGTGNRVLGTGSGKREAGRRRRSRKGEGRRFATYKAHNAGRARAIPFLALFFRVISHIRLNALADLRVTMNFFYLVIESGVRSRHLSMSILYDPVFLSTAVIIFVSITTCACLGKMSHAKTVACLILFLLHFCAWCFHSALR